MTRASLLAITVALGCGDRIGSASAPILSGTFDTTDTSVVALLITSAEGPQDDALCSGTVVSPHVVLTAAHCLDEAIAGPINR